MPIYEYQCQECGEVCEILLISSHQPEQRLECSNCGSSRLEKILSAASYAVKTSGSSAGHTCCGREERCDTPPCSTGGSCRRDFR
ncbi:MAG: zinc ribbon domain-containing protein [Deltaproteobacteria bacterium]|nr:zinc ribbon domain-containing protein [Deltaproteobacteria bacterium]MBW2070650.1 zinc ribbon domain-containing protein [Deltaproteobacteria bacterium]